MSTPSSRTEIAVVGAGVIGLTIALRLAKAGRSVLLIDSNTPGSGASYGNAGTIANYAVLPVGTPSTLRHLPELLFDRDSPFSLRPTAVPTLAPWLLRFAYNSLPGPARANAKALGKLLVDAVPLWQELVDEVGIPDQLRRDGCLYVYETESALAEGLADAARRRELGVEIDVLTTEDVSRLEPSLPATAGGLFFSGAASLSDPSRVMSALADAVSAAGCIFLRDAVTKLARDRGGVLIETRAGRVLADAVVLAAGAHSRNLAAMVGDREPLDTERGYHIEFDLDDLPVSRPVCRVARGFYFVPMAGRLRVAGTVELGGTVAPADPRRIDYLVRGAKEFFADLGEPDRKWLGFRPSMPNSVPVVRPSRRGGDVVLAFGHGHLGLTLAPVTAWLVAGLVTGCSQG